MKKISIHKTILVVCVIVSLLAPSICTNIVYAMDEDIQNEVEEEIIDDKTVKSQETQNIDESAEEQESSENKDVQTTNVIANEPKQNISVLKANAQSAYEPMAISENVINVPEGEGTLQQAIKSAGEGAVLKLQRGEYRGEEIVIDKAITITGVGSSRDNGSIIIPKIKIQDTTKEKKVVIQNVFLGTMQPPSEGFNFIDVQSPVSLDINDIYIFYIYRPNNTKTSATISLGENSDNSTININNSNLNGYFTGLDVKSSQNTITIDNSKLSGQLAIGLTDGSDNNIIVKNNSTITGRSMYFTSDEAISISKQQNLTIDVENSTIIGNDSKGDRNTHIFSFDGENASSNVKINIKGNSVINDINAIKGSTIFNFGESNTPSNTNIITVEKNVKMTPNTVEYKYNTDNEYAVVGIYDKEGKLTIKAYDKSKKIPESEYDSSVSKWYKVTNTTSTFDKEELISENMDLHPVPEEEIPIKVNIVGKEETYNLNAGQSINNNEDLKNALEELKDVEGKTFSRFVTQDGTIIEESTEIFKDITITPKYKVKVTIQNGETQDQYEIEEGQNISYIPQDDLNKYETGKTDKSFSRYETVNTEGKSTIISKSEAINENITIKPVYYVTVTIKIGDQELRYNIDEGKDLKNGLVNAYYYNIQSVINKQNKVFQYFLDEGNQQIKFDTPITKNTTLTAQFKVRVSVYSLSGEVKKEYDIEVGQTLKQAKGDSIGEELQGLVENFNNKTFEHFIDDKGNIVTAETQINENTNFKPVYNNQITIEIYNATKDNKKTYTIESGENLNTLTDKIEEINNWVKSEEEKDFSHFTDTNGNIVDFSTSILEHTILTPVYKITLTVEPKNESIEKFDVIEGTKFETVKQEQLQKFNLTNKTLTNYVYKRDDNTTVVGDSDTFNVHTTIIPKYNVTVTVKRNAEDEPGQSFTMEEGATLESLGSSLDVFDKEESLTGKHFDKYIDINTNEEVKKDVQINENITIIPTYNVKVSIKKPGALDEVETYTIPENQSLRGFGGDELVNTISELVKVDNKTFSGNFVDETDNKSIDFDMAIDKDRTLTPKYNITVKINVGNDTVKEVTLPEQSSLNSLGDAEVAKIKEAVQVQNKTFKGYFVEADNGSNKVEFSTLINENKTLKAQYTVKVTINKKDGSNLKEYTLDEGQNLETKSEDLQAIENPGDTKSFAGYFDEKGAKVEKSTPINENTTLIAKYNVTVKVGDNSYTLGEGETLENLIDTQLNEIKEFANRPSNKTFANYFVDTNGNRVEFNTEINANTELTPKYTVKVTINKTDGSKLKEITLEEGQNLQAKSTELQEIENPGDTKTFAGYFDDAGSKVENTTPINENKILTVKYNVSVKIGSKTYTLEEGKTLNDLISTQLDEIKTYANNPSNKTFANYFVDTNGSRVEFNTEINANTELTPKYTVTITILGEKIEGIEEGKKLSELSQEQKEKIEGLVKKTNKQFVGFAEIDDNTPITENKTLTPKYTVTITILGEKIEGIEEGKKLSELSQEQKEKLQNLVEKTNKQFVGFIEIDDNTPITENKTLTPKYEVNVQIGTQTFNIEEGKTLKDLIDSNPNVGELLENLKTSKDKTFSRFVNQDGNSVEEDTAFNKNTTILAKYNITITVQKVDGKTEEFILEEGSTLDNLSREDKERLQAIKDDHAEGERFARLVDATTGKEIKENEPINGNIVIKPIYDTKTVVEQQIPSQEKNVPSSNYEIVSPKTNDNVLTYVVLGLLGLTCIVISIIAYRKNNK